MAKSKELNYSYYVEKYLKIYLPGERGLSSNTIFSYSDAFVLFGKFLLSKNIRPEKQPISVLNREIIIEFANWLEQERGCSISTRNQRVTALKAFSKWLAYEEPTFLRAYSEIDEIKLKKAPKPSVNYLSVEAMQHLLEMPDSSTKSGLRDLTLLALTYDTGARVSEIVDIVYKDIRFEEPPTIILTGKGNKSRIVPLLPQTVKYLQEYSKRWNVDVTIQRDKPVFTNRFGEKMTRAGIAYILNKYTAEARQRYPTLFPEDISPHTLRHTKAMHLLQSGVNTVYIRDILGHCSVKTTDRYAHADTKMKREALEKAEIKIPQPDTSTNPEQFSENVGIEDDMILWLRNLQKK